MRPDLQKTGLSGDSVTGIAPVIQPSSPAGTAPSHPVTQSTINQSPSHPPPSRPSARWKTRTRCRGACRWPACGRRSELCKPTGVTLGGDSRVVVMLDRGGVGKSLVNRLEKLGATRADAGAGRGDRRAGCAAQGLAGRGADPGRLLAAGAGRGAGHRGDEPGRVARAQPRACQEPLHRHARAVRRGARAQHLPGVGHAAGRAARLRRCGRHGPAGRRSGRLHQGLRHGAGAAARGCGQGRDGQGGGLRGGAARRPSRPRP